MKRPSFQFYPGDWLRDTALRSCSIAARGLWADMLCLMHEGTPYGHLKVKSKVIDKVTLARMVGAPPEKVREYLAELDEAGVFSRDKNGTIFSRRMVQDEKLRQARAEGGKQGGNPALGKNYNRPGFIYAMRRGDGCVKLGISLSPEKRASRLRKSLGDDTVKLVAKKQVPDMGAAEAALHLEYAAFCKIGEWFAFTPAEADAAIAKHFHHKVSEKQNQTPSSASASPSPNAFIKGGKKFEPLPMNDAQLLMLIRDLEKQVDSYGTDHDTERSKAPPELRQKLQRIKNQLYGVTENKR